MLTGNLPDDTLLQDACKEVADLCVHCHMCRLECPANVDIPKLMLEAKAAYVAPTACTLHDWLLTRIDTLAALAGRLPGIANWALRNPQARWLLEKVDRHRPGPQAAAARAAQLSAAIGPAPAASPAAHRRRESRVLRRHVRQLLRHAAGRGARRRAAAQRHRRLTCRQDQLQAGMPMIAAGRARAGPRRSPSKTSRMLAEAVRQGYTIVATEPSAVLA